MSDQLNYRRGYKTRGLYNPDYAPKSGICFIDPVITPMRREYCGPTAIAAVTASSLDEVRSKIYQLRRRYHDVRRDGSDKPITGMDFHEINSVMEALGWRVVGDQEYGSPSSHLTLRRFAKDFGDQGPFIADVGGHVVAISEGDLCDTKTVFPVPLKLALRLEEVREYRIQKWCRYERVLRRRAKATRK